MASEPNGDLATQFLVLNHYLYTGGDRAGAVQRLVDLAASTVPGCDWAAITAWPMTGNPRSLAVSGDVAAAADRLQYDAGDGPCLDAAANADVVLVDDIAAESRWPLSTDRLLSETAVRAVVSFHLVNQSERIALNLYSSQAGAFDDDAVTTATLFAAHARVLLVHAASADKAAQLERALTASRQIGAAVGILMHAYKVSDDEAFDMLRRSSQNLNRKLRDIAADVTLTGVLPTRLSVR